MYSKVVNFSTFSISVCEKRGSLTRQLSSALAHIFDMLWYKKYSFRDYT